MRNPLHAPSLRPQRLRRFVLKQGMILLGAALAALGYSLFQVPIQLAAGGISGVGVIVNHFTGWPVGLLYFIMNIPLMVLGYKQLGGMRFLLSTFWAVACFSVFADLFAIQLPLLMDRYPVSDDLLLNAIYGGVVGGLGTGLIYRAGSTIGGTSIPARIISRRTGFPMSQAYMFSDLAIIVSAGFVFSWEKALLAVLTLVLSGIVADFVLEGVSQVRMALIVTDKPKEVSHALMAELGRGLSFWPVKGGYTETERTMIYCTVRRSEIFDLRWAVSRTDPHAFLVIGMAQNAWGGFGFRTLCKGGEDEGE